MYSKILTLFTSKMWHCLQQVLHWQARITGWFTAHQLYSLLLLIRLLSRTLIQLQTPNISDAELMTNTSKGYTYNATIELQKA